MSIPSLPVTVLHHLATVSLLTGLCGLSYDKSSSIHTFRLSLTLFFVRENYLGRKVNLHFFRAAAKNCLKRKLV